VIAAGALVLAAELAHWTPAAPGSWMVYVALAALASTVNLRLPGIEGTWSLSSLFLLYGVAHFPLAETLLAGCAGAVAQSLVNTRLPRSPIRVLFNTANVAISVSACFVVGRVWMAAGMAHHLPAVMALVAWVYFMVNTVLVSGVLSLLQSKPLGEVCRQWYTWSFPCYLVGVTLVGLVPEPGQKLSWEDFLILLPVAYLVYFFRGLAERQSSLPSNGEPSNALPRSAKIYFIGVVASGVMLLAAAVLGWESENPIRFLAYLVLGVLASTFKIRLPRVQGTLTPAFVLLLVAIAQLSLQETIVVAAATGVVQVLWRSARRPRLAQVLFNPAGLMLSAGLAWVLTRTTPGWLPEHSVAAVLVVSTLILYGSNTLIVAAIVALLNRKPLGSVWQPCYFWSLPYYLVGAAAAGIMTATTRTADWPPSLLVLPIMGLLYVSYRAQIEQAIVNSKQVPA
jgi:hypothetical protein